jgi:hypothetical protein
VYDPSMGERARSIFDEAERIGGLLGKIRLASIAQITSSEAATCVDSPEVIDRLRVALEQLRDRREAKPEALPALSGEILEGESVASTLRQHLRTLLDLMAQRSVYFADLDATIRRIVETASTTLKVARASLWRLSADRTTLTCLDLYEHRTRGHSSGVVLVAREHAPYFTALRTERTIAAHDAHGDPRTMSFSAGYLVPLGITSMLDVPVWHDDEMVGVLCHEHIGKPRRWNSDEETFAYLMGSIVGLAMERAGPRSDTVQRAQTAE